MTKRRRPGRVKSRPKALHDVAAGGTVPDMKGSPISPVTIVRLAATDAPSLREVARIVGVSPTLISKFELGQFELNDEHLAQYAEAIGRAVEDVRARWIESALSYHTTRVSELRAKLFSVKKRGARRGPRPKARA